MKKQLSLCLIIIISTVSYSYPQKVHQHIVTQAEALLEMEFPYINFSLFNSYIGEEVDYGNFNFIGNEAVCESDWRQPYINAGAWREDSSNPYFTNWNNVTELFNSHFWNSNAGDNSCGLPMGAENYLNAYQKAMAYVNGGIEFDLWYGDNGGIGYTHIFPYAIDPTQSLTISDHHGLRVKINSDLPTFHKEGIIEIKGYYRTYTGSHCPGEGSDYYEYSTSHHVIIPNDGSLDGNLDREYITMQLLGRIAHLLMDMSVPAHAHMDDHICDLGDPDYYELWCGNPAGTLPENLRCEYGGSDFAARQYTASTALSAGGIIDMRDIANPIRYLFYLTNQIALHYPCGNPDGTIDASGSTELFGGDNNGSPYFGEDDYSILLTIPGIQNTPPDAVNPEQQAEVLMNWAIRATAGLFYWFMVESEMIDEVECRNWAYMTNVYSKFKILDKTSGAIIADDIDHEEKTLLRHNYDYTVKTKQWDPGYNSLWHYNWNNNQSEYMLKHDFTTAPNQVQKAIFARRNPVMINSDHCDIIQVRDPWYVDPEDEIRYNPPIYQEIQSGSSYPVFLNQNYAFDDTKPIYRLKAPHIGQVTSSDIYVFDHWESPSATVAVFNAQGATTTTNRETPVVFKQAGATVTAVYVSANDYGKTVTVSAGESLSLPAGAVYDISDAGFKIDIEGALNIQGTAAAPIQFQTDEMTNYWGGIEVKSGGKLKTDHGVLKNAGLMGDILAAITVRAGADTVIIRNSEISYTTQFGINAYSPIKVEHCLFHHSGVYFTGPVIRLNVAKNEYGAEYYICQNTFVNNKHTAIYIDVTEGSSNAAGLSGADSKGQTGYLSSPEDLVKPVVAIYNNIIAYNDSSFYLADPATQDIVIYMSNNDEYENTNTSTYGTTIRSGNISLDPLFADTSALNFALQSNSPCIDAGNTQLAYDPDGTPPDIGAFYYHQPPATPTGFNGVWYNNHPKVYWNAVAESDLSHYEVWKRKNGVWSLRTTTTNTYYVDNSESRWIKTIPFTPSETIYYKVRSVDAGDITSEYTASESFLVNDDIYSKDTEYPTVEIDPIPTEFCLHPVYPNPFNIMTTLNLDLPEETKFSLAIYDIKGSAIWRLNNRRTNTWPAGYHRIVWDGRDNSGAVVPTGVYFIVYHSPERKLTQKVVLMK